MRFARLLGMVLLLQSGFCGLLWSGEFRMANGNTLRGEIVSADEDGMVVRLDVGGFSRREPWVGFSQETLRTLAADTNYAAFVEPFIELAPEEIKAREKKKEIVVRDVVARTERPSPRPGLFAGFMSPMGLLILLALLGANLYGAYEVALFRQRPVPVVCVVSLLLPVLGPILFLALPAPETHSPATTAPEETAAPIAAGAAPDRAGSGLSLAAMEKPATASAQTQPQIYQRGEHTFNRRFFESKFPGFFRVVIGDAEKDLVVVIRTPKNEYVGRRISRISMNELHLQLLSTGNEVSIAFSEITTVILRHKDAKT